MKGPFYFGIDGGGTRSRIAVVDSGGLLRARLEGGSTNLYAVSREEVFQNLKSLLEGALGAASLEKGDLAAGCVGSAGLGRPGDRATFRQFIDALLGENFPAQLCGDGELLLVGGLANPEGYCLIAGTGSIALGRSRDGRLVRAGGLGYLLGDEGAAAWIGRTAIARALRSGEGRDLPSALMPALLAAAGLPGAEDFIRYVHHDADKARIAALAPVVTGAAREQDPLALEILQEGARELALLVKSVLDQSPWIENKTLVLAGGVLEHDEILGGGLRQILERDFPFLRVEKKRGSALEGACMLASKAAAT